MRGGHCILTKCALPVIVRYCILIIIVPNAVDTRLSQGLYSIIPPLKSSSGGEINMAAFTTLTSTGTPQSCLRRPIHPRISEQRASILQLLILRVVLQYIRLYIGNQPNASSLIFFNKALWIREAVLIPGKHIPRLWFCL